MAEKPNGDTPPEQQIQPPAGANGDTPPTKPVLDPIEDLKNQVDREKARAATALSEKDAAEKKARDEKILRIATEKKLKALAGAGDGGNGGAPASDDDDGDAEVERVNAEKGVSNLLLMNPQYQTLMQKDQTLKEVLVNNPLSLISEYIDAEDAVEQIKKKLDKRLEADSANAGGAEKPKPQDPPAPGGEKIEMKGNITPQQAAAMSPEEWAKLPKEQREKILKGEY